MSTIQSIIAGVLLGIASNTTPLLLMRRIWTHRAKPSVLAGILSLGVAFLIIQVCIGIVNKIQPEATATFGAAAGVSFLAVWVIVAIIRRNKLYR